MTKDEIIKAVTSGVSKGARFVSFLYKAKGSGESAIYTINMGVDLSTAYQTDLEKLQANLDSLGGYEHQACGEMIASIHNSLTQHATGEKNTAYKLKDTYENIGKAIRLTKETGDLQIYGFVVNKQVLVEGEHKQVKSSQKTLAKKKLKRDMKSAKFRPFIVTPEHISGIRMNGDVLEIHS